VITEQIELSSANQRYILPWRPRLVSFVYMAVRIMITVKPWPFITEIMNDGRVLQNRAVFISAFTVISRLKLPDKISWKINQRWRKIISV
jgi:uncharacterized membrane protein